MIRDEPEPGLLHAGPGRVQEAQLPERGLHHALVRELHREWLVGLTEGELQRPEPLLPTDDQRRARERHVKADGLTRLLADLPMNARTRISLARDVGEAFFGEGPNGFPLEARNVVELGGFVVMGPIETSEIARRFGAGDFRITAYGFSAVHATARGAARVP